MVSEWSILVIFLCALTHGKTTDRVISTTYELSTEGESQNCSQTLPPACRNDKDCNSDKFQCKVVKVNTGTSPGDCIRYVGCVKVEDDNSPTEGGNKTTKIALERRIDRDEIKSDDRDEERRANSFRSISGIDDTDHISFFARIQNSDHRDEIRKRIERGRFDRDDRNDLNDRDDRFDRFDRRERKDRDDRRERKDRDDRRERKDRDDRRERKDRDDRRERKDRDDRREWKDRDDRRERKDRDDRRKRKDRDDRREIKDRDDRRERKDRDDRRDRIDRDDNDDRDDRRAWINRLDNIARDFRRHGRRERKDKDDRNDRVDWRKRFERDRKDRDDRRERKDNDDWRKKFERERAERDGRRERKDRDDRNDKDDWRERFERERKDRDDRRKRFERERKDRDDRRKRFERERKDRDDMRERSDRNDRREDRRERKDRQERDDRNDIFKRISNDERNEFGFSEIDDDGRRDRDDRRIGNVFTNIVGSNTLDDRKDLDDGVVIGNRKILVNGFNIGNSDDRDEKNGIELKGDRLSNDKTRNPFERDDTVDAVENNIIDDRNERNDRDDRRERNNRVETFGIAERGEIPSLGIVLDTDDTDHIFSLPDGTDDGENRIDRLGANGILGISSVDDSNVRDNRFGRIGANIRLGIQSADDTDDRDSTLNSDDLNIRIVGNRIGVFNDDDSESARLGKNNRNTLTNTDDNDDRDSTLDRDDINIRIRGNRIGIFNDDDSESVRLGSNNRNALTSADSNDDRDDVFGAINLNDILDTEDINEGRVTADVNNLLRRNGIEERIGSADEDDRRDDSRDREDLNDRFSTLAAVAVPSISNRNVNNLLRRDGIEERIGSADEDDRRDDSRDREDLNDRFSTLAAVVVPSSSNRNVRENIELDDIFETDTEDDDGFGEVVGPSNEIGRITARPSNGVVVINNRQSIDDDDSEDGIRGTHQTITISNNDNARENLQDALGLNEDILESLSGTEISNDEGLSNFNIANRPNERANQIQRNNLEQTPRLNANSEVGGNNGPSFSAPVRRQRIRINMEKWLSLNRDRSNSVLSENNQVNAFGRPGDQPLKQEAAKRNQGAENRGQTKSGRLVDNFQSSWVDGSSSGKETTGTTSLKLNNKKPKTSYGRKGKKMLKQYGRKYLFVRRKNSYGRQGKRVNLKNPAVSGNKA